MPLAVRRSGKQAVPWLCLLLSRDMCMWFTYRTFRTANLPGFLVARYIRSLPACWWWPRSVSTVDLGQSAGLMLGWFHLVVSSAVGPASYGWWMIIYWSYLIHDCGFQQGTLGGPLYLYACLRSEWWHRHALSWFQQHSSSSMAGLCWWVRDEDDEVSFLKPGIYLFWSGAGSGFWYGRCLLLSLVQIGQATTKEDWGLGITT